MKMPSETMCFRVCCNWLESIPCRGAVRVNWANRKW